MPRPKCQPKDSTGAIWNATLDKSICQFATLKINARVNRDNVRWPARDLNPRAPRRMNIYSRLWLYSSPRWKIYSRIVWVIVICDLRHFPVRKFILPTFRIFANYQIQLIWRVINSYSKALSLYPVHPFGCGFRLLGTSFYFEYALFSFKADQHHHLVFSPLATK